MIDATLREMASSAGLSGAQTEEVLRVLEEYLAELERGARPHPEELLARHPDLADLLKEYLDRLDLLHEAAVRFRVAEPPVDAPVGADRAGAGSPDPAPAPPNDLGQLGDFQLLREVGRGGMGIVYEAEQISLGRRRVALKTLQFAGTMDPRQLTRFQNEARAAACLHHTNIVPVYAVGSERGIHYYAMQFIDGQDLASAVTQLRAQAGHKEPPPQPAETVDAPAGQPAASPTPDTRPIAGLHTERSTRPAEYFRTVARLGIQAAEALDHAHQQGIVHRDIKPANLMVDAAGQLWVTDFGLALIQTDVRLSMSGDLIGTLRYMSPEQALGKRAVLDLRTDIYSLGATLYELLTLEPVHDGKDRQELLRQIAFEEPRRPRRLNRAIPAELETIVLKALAHNPGDRYGTAQELANDLRNFLENRPILAKPPSLQQRARKWAARHKALVGSAASVLAVALFLLAGSIGWVARAESMRRVETERVVGAASTESTSWQEKGRLPEALSEARRAVGLADGGTADDNLRQRVRARLADLELVATLDNVPLDMTASAGSRFFDTEKADLRYAEAFRTFGIDVDALTPEEAGERIRRTTVAVELADTLHYWVLARQDHRGRADTTWLHLLQVARFADPDEERNRLRDGVERKDRKVLLGMAAADATFRLRPATLSLLGNVLQKVDADKEALVFFRRAQRRYRDDFWLNYDLGKLLLMARPRQNEEAVRCCLVAVALRPQSPSAYLNLGLALRMHGDLDGAIAEYGEAISLDPNYAAAYCNLGNVFRDQGNLREAEAACLKAIALKPDYSDAYSNLGNTLSDQGKLPEAVEAYLKAIQMDPKFAGAFVNLAIAFKAQKELQKAEEACRTAIRLEPTFAGAHNTLGTVLRAKKDLLKAEEACLTAVKLDPEYDEAYYNLGNILGDQKKLAEAEKAYRAAIKLKHDYAEAYCNLGQLLKQQGRFTEAVAELKRGHELGSRNPRWQYPSASWVRQAERLVELDTLLPRVLKGAAKPASNAECIILAQFCQQYKTSNLTAVHFFENAFAAEPGLVNDLRLHLRYNAACAAALAGCGRGKDADKLDAKKYAELRDKARSWLWDDLNAWRALLERAPDTARPIVHKTLQHWQQDTDLNGVRGEAALAKLPEAERQKWKNLWIDVEGLARQAAASQTK